MSAAIAAAAAAALSNRRTTTTASSSSSSSKNYCHSYTSQRLSLSRPTLPRFSLYELQKRQDWDTFRDYLKNHHHRTAVLRCSVGHVLQFLLYLDQFGKTRVHNKTCPFYGRAHPPAPCPCPFKQAWSSLDAVTSRLRSTYEEHGGSPESNPFGEPAVLMYLREVRESQAKARGI